MSTLRSTWSTTSIQILRRSTTTASPILPRNQFLPLTPIRHVQTNPNPQRNAQGDREKINTDANEYAKSGTDDTVAGNEQAAFDPKITDPQEAKKKAGEGNEVNPLDASPANPKLSTPTREGDQDQKKKGG